MRLEIARRQKLMSQADLAEKAGVARSTVHLIEVGKTTPRLSIMRRISEALEVAPAEIDEFRRAIGQEKGE
ncbi:MAG: helix-turn-helix domain-containing protein [Candidatus Marsarchaeota archaeon]|nr:helix-turn-helix domain-containing protein [Candidatus Marsarchaeota archaeon]